MAESQLGGAQGPRGLVPALDEPHPQRLVKRPIWDLASGHAFIESGSEIFIVDIDAVVMFCSGKISQNLSTHRPYADHQVCGRFFHFTRLRCSLSFFASLLRC